MEPRVTQATQGVSELLPLGGNIDAIELTDKDLEKVTGTHWGGMGGFGFRPFFHRPPFGFNNGTAIAISTVAVAIA